MIHKWINKKYLQEDEIKKINSGFKKAKPYSNFALENFFNAEKLADLKNAVLAEKFEHVEKDLFSFSHTKDLVSSKNKKIKEFYNMLSSKEFILLMGKLTGIKLSSKIDMQSHNLYRGDYLLFHDDELEGRGIAYIVYLSNFQKNDGGKLQLYDLNNPSKPVKSIIPKLGTFTCFKVSKKSMHDVEEVIAKKERLTVGGWFYGN